MLKTFAAVLLATSMIAGASLAAAPSGGAGPAPAVTTSGNTQTVTKVKLAKQFPKHLRKHARQHSRKHHVARGKLPVQQAHQLRSGKTHKSHVVQVGKHVGKHVSKRTSKATKAAAKLPAARTSTN